jgi:glycosyltransferase involved in cell wall biosynthesis
VLASSQVGAFQGWAASEGVPSYHVPFPFPDRRRPWAFVSALVRLRSIASRHAVELVHCNEHDTYPIGSYLARWLGVPVVVSVHFTMDRGYCSWAFAGWRQPARMFFVSAGNREACRPGLHGVVPEDRWRVLYNGLDLTRFVPDSDRRAAARAAWRVEDTPSIGVACALRPRKQIEHLVVAAGQCATRPRVVVAGAPVKGDEEYAKKLLADARSALGDRLTYLGHLDELRDFYCGLDLFVNTSQEEACSISVMESLACGTPVVGYASKSVDDQILPDGGEIVPQDDTPALVAALDRWLGDPSRLQAARAGARRQAERKFDIEACAEQLWAEYRDVLTRDQRSDRSRPA